MEVLGEGHPHRKHGCSKTFLRPHPMYYFIWLILFFIITFFIINW